MADLGLYEFTELSDRALLGSSAWILAQFDVANSLGGSDIIFGRGTGSRSIGILIYGQLITAGDNDELSGIGSGGGEGMYLSSSFNGLGGLIATGEGNDTIRGRGGANIVYDKSGGGGDGIVIYGTLDTGTENDSIIGDGGSSTNGSPNGRGLLISLSGIILTGDGNDIINGTSGYPPPGASPRVGSSEGIYNSGTINTGAGNDSISGTSPYSFTDVQTGGNGVHNAGLIDTEYGDDTIFGSGGSGGNPGHGIYNSGSIITSDGNDSIRGVGGAGLNGSADIFNDGIIDTGNGDDCVTALAGFGGSGTTNLGNGNDFLKGFGTGSFVGGNGIDAILLQESGMYLIADGKVYLNDRTMIVSSFEAIGGVDNGLYTLDTGYILIANGVVVSTDLYAFLPSITLAVLPASVLEDGATNFIYTFTRTGATTNPLTVNYGFAGTADSSDYSGETPGTGKTITFAANSATATLTIDPMADTTFESDETVALTLGAGTGYTVGTTAAVVGTITNDDTPSTTYILTPSATSVNEGSSISYTLTTTNVVSGTNFYYQFSGTGINAADFSSATTTGTEVVGSNGQLTITRTLTADKTTEGTETLTLKVFTDSTATALLVTHAAVTANDASLTSTKPTQQVYTLSPQVTYKPTDAISAPLLYTTSSGDTNLSGLTLNVHYNSSILTPFESINGVSAQLPAAITSTAILSDTSNLDNDPLTDKIIQLVWGTFDSSFPNKTLPAALATVSFNTTATKKDPLTGQPLTTTVRYTASETAAGYDFLTGFTTFKAQQSFNLDVDGDGKMTALGDGLMVIRKLFGAAFAGDALTYKAMSPNATRNTAEISDFIQQGIDGGMLDVDKDGKTTALGDGLIVIRRLFGAAFDGAALINKAISPNSPYFGQASDLNSIGINVDALKLTVL